MSVIKRCAAIDLVINGVINRIVKASEHGDFFELKSILLYGSGGVANMDNKELAATLNDSYQVIDEEIKYPEV